MIRMRIIDFQGSKGSGEDEAGEPTKLVVTITNGQRRQRIGVAHEGEDISGRRSHLHVPSNGNHREFRHDDHAGKQTIG